MEEEHGILPGPAKVSIQIAVRHHKILFFNIMIVWSQAKTVSLGDSKADVSDDDDDDCQSVGDMDDVSKYCENIVSLDWLIDWGLF